MMLLQNIHMDTSLYSLYSVTTVSTVSTVFTITAVNSASKVSFVTMATIITVKCQWLLLNSCQANLLLQRSDNRPSDRRTYR